MGRVNYIGRLLKIAAFSFLLPGAGLFAQSANLVTNFPANGPLQAPANMGITASASILTVFSNTTSVAANYTIYITWVLIPDADPIGGAQFRFSEEHINVPPGITSSATTTTQQIGSDTPMTGKVKVSVAVIKDKEKEEDPPNPTTGCEAQAQWSLTAAEKVTEQNET